MSKTNFLHGFSFGLHCYRRKRVGNLKKDQQKKELSFGGEYFYRLALVRWVDLVHRFADLPPPWFAPTYRNFWEQNLKIKKEKKI
jgi:hypothetical protein